MELEAARSIAVPFAVDFATLYAGVLRGASDCTTHATATELWRAYHTPDGPVTSHFIADSSSALVHAHAFGEGAQWAIDHVEATLGMLDAPERFVVNDERLSRLLKRTPMPRLIQIGSVYDIAVTTVIDQRVTGYEAHRTFNQLVRKYGEIAPGSSSDRPVGLRIAPMPQVLGALSDLQRRDVGLEARRGATVALVARDRVGLERAAAIGAEVLRTRLSAMPGIGEWTIASLLALVTGDADAVPVGDWHLPRIVGHALGDDRIKKGRLIDDDKMLELLEPFRPHRYRVLRLLLAAGAGPPRRTARAEIPDVMAKERVGKPFRVRRTLRFDR